MSQYYYPPHLGAYTCPPEQSTYLSNTAFLVPNNVYTPENYPHSLAWNRTEACVKAEQISRGDIWIDNGNQFFLIVSNNSISQNDKFRTGSAIPLRELDWGDPLKNHEVPIHRWDYREDPENISYSDFAANIYDVKPIQKNVLRKKLGNINPRGMHNIGIQIKNTLNIYQGNKRLSPSYLRGQVYRVNYPPPTGPHPGVILAENDNSVLVALLTSQTKYAPMSVPITKSESGLLKNSFVDTTSTQPVNKNQVGTNRLLTFNPSIMSRIDHGIMETFDLPRR